MQDKVKLVFPDEKQDSFKFGEKIVTVKTYLGLALQKELIENYIEIYFAPNSENRFDYLGAEATLILDVMDKCTNIAFVDDEDKTLFSMDDIISNPELFAQIKTRIKNYDEFYRSLHRVISDIREKKSLEKSVGGVIDRLYETISTFLLEFSSEENIRKVNEMLFNVNNSDVLKEVVTMLAKNETNSTENKS